MILLFYIVIYLMAAVPAVFIGALFVFGLSFIPSGGSFKLKHIAFFIIPFSLLNLFFTTYYFSLVIGDPSHHFAFLEMAWIAAVIISPILLIYSSLRRPIQSTEQDAAANP